MTAKQDFEAFLASQEVEGYTLGDITGSPEGDMIKYTELKLAKASEERILAAFNIEKQAAFNAFETERDVARQALGKVWQAKEDAL